MQEDLEEGVPSQGSEGCCSPRAHPPSSQGILWEEDLLSFPCYWWEYMGTAILCPGCTKGCRCGGFQRFGCLTSLLKGRIGQAEVIHAVLCMSHVRMECSEITKDWNMPQSHPWNAVSHHDSLVLWAETCAVGASGFAILADRKSIEGAMQTWLFLADVLA